MFLFPGLKKGPGPRDVFSSARYVSLATWSMVLVAGVADLLQFAFQVVLMAG